VAKAAVPSIDIGYFRCRSFPQLEQFPRWGQTHSSVPTGVARSSRLEVRSVVKGYGYFFWQKQRNLFGDFAVRFDSSGRKPIPVPKVP